MTASSRTVAAVIATVAITACGRAQGRADSTGVKEGAPATASAESSAAPAAGSAPPAAATSGAPNGAAKPATAASPTSMGKPTTRPAVNAPTKSPMVAVPMDTNPKPPIQPPAGATTPAYIVFRDSILPSDLDWLRAQGFTIVAVTESTHGVRIAVPDSYHGNPKANPRVLRFTIAMR